MCFTYGFRSAFILAALLNGVIGWSGQERGVIATSTTLEHFFFNMPVCVGCKRRTIDLHRITPDISSMVAVRTILTALLTISVALVPATGGAAVSTTPVEMSMPDQADMPCCTPDDCKGSITCALKCFNFVGAIFPASVSLPHLVDAAPPSFVDSELHGHVRSPPTHPPPI
jgi:hypothetical protein